MKFMLNNKILYGIFAGDNHEKIELRKNQLKSK